MLTLHEIMATDLVTVSPDMNLHELAEIFAARGISGAPAVPACGMHTSSAPAGPSARMYSG